MYSAMVDSRNDPSRWVGTLLVVEKQERNLHGIAQRPADWQVAACASEEPEVGVMVSSLHVSSCKVDLPMMGKELPRDAIARNCPEARVLRD